MHDLARRPVVAVLLTLFASIASAQTQPASPPTEGVTIEAADKAFAAVLKAVVTDDGLVRYDRLAERPIAAQLDRAVAGYASNQPPTDETARLAFFMNAYNAIVLDRVDELRRKGGFESVIKVPGFFDRDQVRVGGASMTLNDLENNKVRPLGDARIHAALVCAAVSCPPLRAEPFAATKLDQQLDDQSRRWVNDPAKFRVVSGGAVGLSKILDWYGEDFTDGGPLGFVRRYATSGSRLHERASAGAQSMWLEYDWSLNQAR